MDAHAALDEWETAPFDGGLEEAARLAQQGFSGAIRAGSTWLFIADGHPVAVVTDLDGTPVVGDVDALEGASGETLEAPTAGVARLVPMLALGGEVRGQYFSDDTPVGTVQDTLENGGFTGYVELAENVLSGDYYVVFVDGVAEYVAFIGSTEQLVTGPDAERKTKNEVGIYTVTAVDLPDVELPDPPADAGRAGGGAVDDGVAGAGAAVGTGASAGGRDATAGDATETPSDADAGEATDTTGAVGAGAGTDPEDASGAGESTPDRPASTESGSESDGETTGADADPAAVAERGATEPTRSQEDPSAAPSDEGGVGGPDGAAEDASRGVDESAPGVGVGAGRAEPLTDEASGSSAGSESSGDPASSDAGADEPATEVDASGEAGSPDTGPEVPRPEGSDAEVGGAGVGPTGSSSEASTGGESVGAAADAVEALRGDLRDLRSAVDHLEGRVAALESAGDGDAAVAARPDGPSLSPSEALSQTTLFVREGTRGGPTLEDGHDGTADRNAVAQNVGLERHTRFDETGATVEGEPYERFLEGSQAYRFVEWLTKDLLFEIRTTDSVGSMSKLYDALPELDRVFFQESVSVRDGEETVELTFDVVVRDRNGAPLVVASLDDSRDPTPSSRVERLVTDASDFGAANGTLVGAFGVTASYFETEALEVAHEATTSSLLSRGTYKSYVSLTRKNGFHLCLVEARDSALHLTQPEL